MIRNHLFSWPMVRIRVTSGLVALLCAGVGWPLAVGVEPCIRLGTRLQAVAILMCALLLPTVGIVVAVFDCGRTRAGAAGASFWLSLITLIVSVLWALLLLPLFFSDFS